MTSELLRPPVLSTSEDQIIEAPATDSLLTSTLQDAELSLIYDVQRTAHEISLGGWRNIALQFPDHMLVDAPRVAQLLDAELRNLCVIDDGTVRVHILADTSYSACCVDEIAAEHANAHVVVHYGRACLSSTSRLPVIYVSTSHSLDHHVVVERFRSEFADLDSSVVLMADLPYQNHVGAVTSLLEAKGYRNLRGTAVERDPNATIPNRRILGPRMTQDIIRSYSVFHISDPPTALLLVLQTRFASLHVLATSNPSALAVENPTLRAAGLIRRRFARVLSLASAGVVGILVNTLSVSNYLSSIDSLRRKISKAGKKSYTVVVGKLNPAKLANFAEIEGWVVVGCWESGLVEDDAAYWRPVVTPYEMEVALMNEEERIWGLDWWGGLERLGLGTPAPDDESFREQGRSTPEQESFYEIDEEESLPPQFDLRTGKLVSHSRPMRLTAGGAASLDRQGADVERTNRTTCHALVTRKMGELAQINGVASPGAEYLRSKRTWQGLGSDFNQESSTPIEEGRSGVARGYSVGDDKSARR